MKLIEHYIVTFCRLGVALAFGTLIICVLVQVMARSFASSPIWTEELTRYALLYLCAFGAGLAFRSGDLVNVDIVCESLPGQWPRVSRMVAAILTFALCATLLIPAWKYVAIGALQTSPAMAIRMTYVHLSVFVLIAGLMAFSLLRVLLMLFYNHDGLADNRSEAD